MVDTTQRQQIQSKDRHVLLASLHPPGCAPLQTLVHVHLRTAINPHQTFGQICLRHMQVWHRTSPVTSPSAAANLLFKPASARTLA